MSAPDRVAHFWISEPDLVAALRNAAAARGVTIGALARDIVVAWSRGEVVAPLPRAEMTALRNNRRASR
jgi:hypothetical protein